MISLIALLALQDLVAVSPEPRTGAQLATALSAEHRVVTADATVAERGYVVRVKGKSWTDLKPLLESGLGLRVREATPEHWVIEPDPAVLSRERSALTGYVNLLDNRARDAIKAAIRLGNGMPAAPGALEKLAQEVNPGGGLGGLPQALNSSTMSEAEKDGWRIAMGVAGARDPSVAVSGPAIATMEGNSVRTLIPTDRWMEGTMYQWRDDKSLAPWVRERAVAFARNAETALVILARTNPQEAQRQLNEQIGGMYLSHRTHFEPRTGEIFYEFAFLTKELYGPGWYDRSVVQAFSMPLTGETLAKCLGKENEPAMHDRISASKTAFDQLRGKSWSRQTADGSLSAAMLAIADKGDTDLVMEIQPVRDRNLTMLNGSAPKSGRLSDIGPWIVEDAWKPSNAIDSRYRNPAYTLELSNGTMIVRDEWAFLDRNWKVPFGPLFDIKKTFADTKPLFEVAAAAGKMDDKAMRKMASADIDNGGFVSLYPVLAWLDKLPIETKESLTPRLAVGDEVVIPTTAAGEAPRLLLNSRMAQWMRENPWHGDVAGATRSVLLLPRVNEVLKVAEVHIERENEERLKVWVVFITDSDSRKVPCICFSDRLVAKAK